MSVAKVVHLIASSEKSFEAAVEEGVARAAETVHGIHGVKIKDWTAEVTDNKVTKYRVSMDVAFGVGEKK